MAKESHSATDISTQIENLTCIRMASHQLTASVSAELQGNSAQNQTQYYNNNYYESNPIGNDQLYIQFCNNTLSDVLSLHFVNSHYSEIQKSV